MSDASMYPSQPHPEDESFEGTFPTNDAYGESPYPEEAQAEPSSDVFGADPAGADALVGGTPVDDGSWLLEDDPDEPQQSYTEVHALPEEFAGVPEGAEGLHSVDAAVDGVDGWDAGTPEWEGQEAAPLNEEDLVGASYVEPETAGSAVSRALVPGAIVLVLAFGAVGGWAVYKDGSFFQRGGEDGDLVTRQIVEEPGKGTFEELAAIEGVSETAQGRIGFTHDGNAFRVGDAVVKTGSATVDAPREPGELGDERPSFEAFPADDVAVVETEVIEFTEDVAEDVSTAVEVAQDDFERAAREMDALEAALADVTRTEPTTPFGAFVDPKLEDDVAGLFGEAGLDDAFAVSPTAPAPVETVEEVTAPTFVVEEGRTGEPASENPFALAFAGVGYTSASSFAPFAFARTDETIQETAPEDPFEAHVDVATTEPVVEPFQDDVTEAPMDVAAVEDPGEAIPDMPLEFEPELTADVEPFDVAVADGVEDSVEDATSEDGTFEETEPLEVAVDDTAVAAADEPAEVEVRAPVTALLPPVADVVAQVEAPEPTPIVSDVPFGPVYDGPFQPAVDDVAAVTPDVTEDADAPLDVEPTDDTVASVSVEPTDAEAPTVTVEAEPAEPLFVGPIFDAPEVTFDAPETVAQVDSVPVPTVEDDASLEAPMDVEPSAPGADSVAQADSETAPSADVDAQVDAPAVAAAEETSVADAPLGEADAHAKLDAIFGEGAAPAATVEPETPEISDVFPVPPAMPDSVATGPEPLAGPPTPDAVAQETPVATEPSPAPVPTIEPTAVAEATPTDVTPIEVEAKPAPLPEKVPSLVEEPKKDRHTSVLRRLDTDTVWPHRTVPKAKVDGDTFVLTPKVGNVRVVFDDGESLDGRLHGVGDGRIEVDTNVGRVSIAARRAERIDRVSGPVTTGPGRTARTNGLDYVRVRTAGGVFDGQLLSREGDRVTLLVGEGMRITVDALDVRPAGKVRSAARQRRAPAQQKSRRSQ